jgi:four helix bundle protein
LGGGTGVAGQGQRGFEDLECYQLALRVLEEAYRVAKRLPPEEKFNLAYQMRKAAVSVVLNIAEGYGRYHYLDSLRFYYIARGSLDQQRELCHSALRSLNGFIRYVRKQRQGHQEYGNRLHEAGYPYTINPDPHTEE